MVFSLDNEPIPVIDTSSSILQGGSSIALNPLAWVATNKRKREGLAIAGKISKEFYYRQIALKTLP